MEEINKTSRKRQIVQLNYFRLFKDANGRPVLRKDIVKIPNTNRKQIKCNPRGHEQCQTFYKR